MQIPQSTVGLTIAGLYVFLVCLALYESISCVGSPSCYAVPSLLGGPILFLLGEAMASVYRTFGYAVPNLYSGTLASTLIVVFAYAINAALLYVVVAGLHAMARQDLTDRRQD
jgi:hypothetical protein